MKGIDSLLDLVDDLNLDQQEQDDLIALNDDDDSWSQPALSVFGDDVLDDSFLL